MNGWATLGEVASVNPRESSLIAPEVSVSFVPLADLDARRGATTLGVTRPYGEVSRGYTVFRDGDLLVAKITPSFENGKIGQARLGRPIGVGSTEFHVVRPDGGRVDDRYLLHYLRQDWVRVEGERRMTGSAGQKRVPAAFLEALPVPLPSIEDQRRIAAILDQADTLRVKRRRTVALIDDLVQSAFVDMFDDPAGGRWEITELGQVVGQIDNGASPVCEARPAAHNEWGILKLGAVTYGTFRPTENKAFLGDVGSMAAHEVRPGDVLMTRKNTRDLVGAVAYVETTPRRLLLPDLVFRLHLDEHRLEPRFFQALMMSLRVRHQVQGLASGSAASMPNISKARLRTLKIPVPPLAMQREFAAHVQRIDAQRTVMQRSLEALDELFVSLRSRVFSGGLEALRA